MTYDNGKEMVQHHALSQSTGIMVFFAHPYIPSYIPWERGTNANTERSRHHLLEMEQVRCRARSLRGPGSRHAGQDRPQRDADDHDTLAL